MSFSFPFSTKIQKPFIIKGEQFYTCLLIKGFCLTHVRSKCADQKEKKNREFFFWFLHPKLDVRFSSWEDPSRFRMAYKQEMIDSIYQKPKVWLNILCFKEKTFLLEQFWVKNPSVSLYWENNFEMLLYLKLKVVLIFFNWK